MDGEQEQDAANAGRPNGDQRTKEAVAIEGFKERCFHQRDDITKIKINAQLLTIDLTISTNLLMTDKDEAIANAVLAFRHLEDARMRLGKVVQALDGGASCYPR